MSIGITQIQEVQGYEVQYQADTSEPCGSFKRWKNSSSNILVVSSPGPLSRFLSFSLPVLFDQVFIYLPVCLSLSFFVSVFFIGSSPPLGVLSGGASAHS